MGEGNADASRRGKSKGSSPGQCRAGRDGSGWPSNEVGKSDDGRTRGHAEDECDRDHNGSAIRGRDDKTRAVGRGGAAQRGRGADGRLGDSWVEEEEDGGADCERDESEGRLGAAVGSGEVRVGQEGEPEAEPDVGGQRESPCELLVLAVGALEAVAPAVASQADFLVVLDDGDDGRLVCFLALPLPKNCCPWNVHVGGRGSFCFSVCGLLAAEVDHGVAACGLSRPPDFDGEDLRPLSAKQTRPGRRWTTISWARFPAEYEDVCPSVAVGLWWRHCRATDQDERVLSPRCESWLRPQSGIN